ncbi:MAG TPA: ABC transporter substrate-binding protein [Candidatus Binatia bacterium]|nr:ABC transporter substrate-binding protein [Candidatus Binatia bacterium]
MNVLKTAIATYPHTKGLKDGTVSVPGVQFEHVEISPIIGAFRRMCRTLEFDLCEMAITTYLTAKAHDKPFTALPVFVLRHFHHSPIVYNVKAGVESPKDLEGKKVGVRAYTVTTGVWARGILATEYDVDLSKITWVVVDEEHVQEYRKPANVMERPGANLAKMLMDGELAAAIGVGKIDSPDVKPLISDAAAAEAAWYRKTGIYPINHTVVVKDALLRSDPSLAPRLFAGFEAAKTQFVKQLSSGADLPADAQVLAKRRTIVGDDPLPNGLAPNRKALEAIVRFAHEQKILPRRVEPEEMFAAEKLSLNPGQL